MWWWPPWYCQSSSIFGWQSFPGNRDFGEMLQWGCRREKTYHISGLLPPSEKVISFPGHCTERSDIQYSFCCFGNLGAPSKIIDQQLIQLLKHSFISRFQDISASLNEYVLGFRQVLTWSQRALILRMFRTSKIFGFYPRKTRKLRHFWQNLCARSKAINPTVEDLFHIMIGNWFNC